ncbi:unnamed protein product [Arabis nemorensis]|uniref:tRNA/rRNA methyltransferase SpoU type domain-containing protein n=1 Tax=Arabis nemorensis TaxID=586526 RepID=A0A565CM51_9BRAS|nr:unnamed protein product [Arabis nemorensis]
MVFVCIGFEHSSIHRRTFLNSISLNSIKTDVFTIFKLTGIGTARCCTVHGAAALSLESFTEDSPKNTVKELLTTNRGDTFSMMKMERRCTSSDGEGECRGSWFPYKDRFSCGEGHLSSREVLEAVSPHMMEERLDRFRRVVENRSFSVCLVVEGLSDIGNIAAAFRSADALGIQSVHVVSCDSSKRIGIQLGIQCAGIQDPEKIESYAGD